MLIYLNQCLFNSFCQVIWLECESKVYSGHAHRHTQIHTHTRTLYRTQAARKASTHMPPQQQHHHHQQ
jgi:hypothetical protein